MSHWSDKIVNAFVFSELTIRAIVAGGIASVVIGIVEKDEKKKTFWYYVSTSVVGCAVSVFFAPAIIEYYAITSIRYQMAVAFSVGLCAKVIVSKVIRAVKKLKVNIPNVTISDKEGDEDADI